MPRSHWFRQERFLTKLAIRALERVYSETQNASLGLPSVPRH